ncbi:SPOR domain-containing protein [Bacteroides sp. AF16-49]|uniref:SPOR domain-containing protein n=1 Tax=Bacteroides sp. AF16-49 TaxID=2292192 RepID=UPI000F0093AE|nr:SPOR domain-containing protein [Bacteroides sp. AF16-49]
MRTFLFFFVCFLMMPFYSQSQDILKDLETRKAGEGKVTIHQDSRIGALIGKPNSNNGSGEKKVLKTTGYRVQVYAGNNSRIAREEAAAKASQVKEYFPELPVYTHFSSPRWLCRVGDFKSIEEADATMRKLKATGVFKEVSIVKEVINISL